MPEYILIDEGFEIYRQELEEKEIVSLMESGFVVSVMRLNERKVEYASVNYNTGKLTWKEPKLVLE